jgi:hypothetical protein
MIDFTSYYLHIFGALSGHKTSAFIGENQGIDELGI